MNIDQIIDENTPIMDERYNCRLATPDDMRRAINAALKKNGVAAANESKLIWVIERGVKEGEPTTKYLTGTRPIARGAPITYWNADINLAVRYADRATAEATLDDLPECRVEEHMLIAAAPPSPAAPDLVEPKRWYFSGTLCRYVNGSLVETLHHSPVRSDPSPALVLYDDYAAALAEREKDAERYRARRDSDWCAYDEYCGAVMPRDGTAIRQNSEQFIAQYDQDSDFMLEDYIVGPDAAIDALRGRS